VNTEESKYIVMSHHQNAGQNQKLWKCSKVKVLWDKSNKSKLHSRCSYGENKFRERLL